MPGTRLLGRRELTLLQLLLGRPERVVEHGIDVPGRDLVAKEILYVA